MGILTGPQVGELRDLLVEAFPAYQDMVDLLATRFVPSKNLNALVSTQAINDAYFQLIFFKAEPQDWTLDLLRAVREARPRNVKLLAFSQQFGLASTDKSRKELELIIKQGIGFLDVATWRESLGTVEAQVCRVEVPLLNGNLATGTGFLVGADTVLTNYHVIRPVLKNLASASDITLRFDYKKINAQEINKGTVYKLASGEDWLVAEPSPPSHADTKNALPGAEPGDQELDYAVLRLAEPAGKHTIARVPDINSPLRGWQKLPDLQIPLEPSDPLLILQHPSGDPLKLAIDTSASPEMLFNNKRLRYKTNTLPGSSGSPVFNFNFKLVALHHLGDPSYDEFTNTEAKFNQGIPIALIQADLKSKGGIDAQGEIPALEL